MLGKGGENARFGKKPRTPSRYIQLSKRGSGNLSAKACIMGFPVILSMLICGERSPEDDTMQRTLFTEEHNMFRDSFRHFVKKQIIPYYEQWEKDGMVSRDLWLKAGEQGCLGLDVPEEYGGAGTDDYRYSAIVAEEIERACATSAGLGITLHNDIVIPYFLAYATPEQKQRWLPGMCSGALITAIAMTEPDAGSDLAAIRTTAIRQDDGYLLNGQKTFITNGILSDVVIVVAKTNPALGHKGISLLVVERGMEGFKRGRKREKVGLKAQDTA